MSKVLIFAGTKEGREITEFLGNNRVSVLACVATSYGRELINENEYIRVSDERLDARQMAELIKKENPEVVIDATHPYAADVTGNVKEACCECSKEYLRLVREAYDISDENVVYAESVADAVSKLEGTQGNILAATGSKELAQYTKLSGYRERVFARVLSLPDVVKSCAQLGFEGKHLICMQGPFSKEMNMAMLRQYECRYMVSKESGQAGGFMEKYEAAKECGAVLVLVGRPLKEEGMSFLSLKKELCKRFGIKSAQRITLAGIGMGNPAGMSREVYDALGNCDLLIGAQRMVESVKTSADVLVEYRSEKIAQYISAHPEYENITIALSGDVGFYSGAKKLLSVLPEGVEILPGTSSMVYFCAKIGMAWEDVIPVSLHGRETNIVSLVRDNKKVFAIVGNRTGIGEICAKLSEYGLGSTTVYIGERLSYVNESINCASANAFSDCETDPLSVVLFERRNFTEPVITHGIADEEFIRANVPMTKEEVREISVSKLRLKKDSVCYDVGAGTGSVSVEMARAASRGKVFAVEKKAEAVQLLHKNKEKFACDNLEILEGTAPDILEGLPSPTHVFIGGSSGNLKEIVSLILKKNPAARIVINCITLETVNEALECVRSLKTADADIVQVNIAKSKSVGRYHMMMGQNPVYIISFGGKADM